MTIRNRLTDVAAVLESDRNQSCVDTTEQSNPPELTVFLDSAYVRSRLEYQRRNFEVIVGCIESKSGKKRRFGVSQAADYRPRDCLRTSLKAAGWREGTSVTVLSDGDAALPRLIKDATGADVCHILDWWHISARIRHVEVTFKTLLSQLDSSEIDRIEQLVSGLRWRIWHGQKDRVLDALKILFDYAVGVRAATFGGTHEAALTAASRTLDLRTYLEHNPKAVINYDQRRRSGGAVSTSRAGGLVNEIANARMGKRQRMRWSPSGAHRVATVRAAVLDGRLSNGHIRAA